VGVFRLRYVYVLEHRWNGFSRATWTVWWGSPEYRQCIEKGLGVHVASFIKRHIAMAEGEVCSERAVDEEFARNYPALAEYLTIDWLEGERRETATLGISVDAGQWKARLADRDSGLVTFVSGDGFYAVLDALEGRLARGEADWRRDQYAKPKRKK
jgi:hypothetical protein